MSKLKIGDIVTIRDYSYSYCWNKANNDKNHYSSITIYDVDLQDKYKVIGINCILPARQERHRPFEINNTIIVSINKPELGQIFTQERFLDKVETPEDTVRQLKVELGDKERMISYLDKRMESLNKDIHKLAVILESEIKQLKTELGDKDRYIKCLEQSIKDST